MSRNLTAERRKIHHRGRHEVPRGLRNRTGGGSLRRSTRTTSVQHDSHAPNLESHRRGRTSQTLFLPLAVPNSAAHPTLLPPHLAAPFSSTAAGHAFSYDEIGDRRRA